MSKCSSQHIIASGVRDLMSFIQEPHGTLPYNRAQELADFMTVLLKYALEGDGMCEDLVNRARAEFQSNKLPEFVPSLVYLIHMHCQRVRSDARGRGDL
jgi:glycine oxidase